MSADRARRVDAAPMKVLGRRLLAEPAWAFCLLFGPGLTLFGILGLLVGSADFTTGDDLPREPFPVFFEFNGWHHALHVLSALILVTGVIRPTVAPTAAITFGVTYLIIAPLGFIDGDDVANLVHSGAADNVVHSTLAVLGIAAGLWGTRTAPRGPRRTASALERRNRARD